MDFKCLFVSLGFFFNLSAQAGSSKCQSLVEDLKAMRSAQSQLLQSLGERNEMFAKVLDQNAEKLENTMTVRRSLKRTDLQGLHVSARTFRQHQTQEKALIRRFEKASSELLDQVQSCLQSRQELAKLD